MVLKELLKYGTDNGYFEIQTISDIKEYNCNSKTEMIDFDKVTSKLYKGGDIPCSCDGLKLLIDNKRLDFIEFKSISNMIKFGRNIKKEIKGFKLEDKINCSFETLNKLYFDKVGDNLKNEFNNDIEKNYLVVADNISDGMANIRFAFKMFGETANIYREIAQELKEKLSAINEPKLSNPPIFLKCSRLDSYYSSI